MDALTHWTRTQLTTGTANERFHSHAYYDIPVFDSTERYLTGHEVRFAGRQPTPDDPISIGYIDLEAPERPWTTVGESRAWSWQQGAMSQWLPHSRTLVWNDRKDGRFMARTYDLETEAAGTLPRPVYAVDPQGRYALSLNMGRLDHVRPGYGYPDGPEDRLSKRKPKDDGVWRIDLKTGACTLVLSLREAVRCLFWRSSMKERLKHVLRRYIYWFNHVKISPDGRRFTIKLRFRKRDLSEGWNDQMGVSLTCGTNGDGVRLLTDGTSHVIWLNETQLYLWQRDGVYIYEDQAPQGRRVKQLAPRLLDHNVHIRQLPGTQDVFVYDTPYREDIDLFVLDVSTGERHKIARFENHHPKRGLFRCDLHPCPSPSGKKIAVTSMEDGGRQLYVLER